VPWTVENYYVKSGRILTVEITVPLVEFLYVSIDDVKKAWLGMLSQFASEKPQYEMSWEMAPRETDALVTIRIARRGVLRPFTKKELQHALSAADALFENT
jgi:hypothetical protein